MLPHLWTSLRPAQWVKNLFVVAPAVFGGRLLEPDAAGRVGLAFVSFCLAASAVYLINDLRDREADRLHPLKRHRPIVSGALAPGPAAAAATVLLLASLAGAAALEPALLLWVGAYLALNAVYSWGLKRFVILDVMAVAAGFLIRVAAGGVAVDVELSSWLLLCTLFLALLMAFTKRRHELLLLAGEAPAQRHVLADYSPAFLDQMVNVVTASTVVAYALYAVAPDTVDRFGTEGLVYTVPFVLFGIFRYLFLTYQRPTETSPTEALLRDLPSVVNVVLWGAVVIAFIYLR